MVTYKYMLIVNENESDFVDDLCDVGEKGWRVIEANLEAHWYRALLVKEVLS